MQRAKTVTGLFLQYMRQRWAGFGKSTKLFLVGGLVLAALAAFQFGGCLFGACGASPCSSARQSPCQLSAADDDEPCPYSGETAVDDVADEADVAADDDVPPCHRNR